MRVAAVDVGTNSIHMVIAEVDADGRFRVLDRAKDMVRLGAKTLQSGRLSAKAMDTGIATLSAFRTLAERQGVTRVQAVATSAVREAANGGDFITRVKREVGWRVKVIHGLEEARLIYLGVRHAVDLATAPTLIADIGGGSVELIVVDGGEPVWMDSLKLGVARLTDAYVGKDPPSGKEIEALEKHIDAALQTLAEALRRHPVSRVVGTSGTLLNLIAMAAQSSGASVGSTIHNLQAPAGEFAKLRRAICKATRGERQRLKGLDAKRADLIVAGAVLAERVVAAARADTVVACTWALREGVLLDFIARHRKGIEETETYENPRARSVARLARHLGETNSHGKQVAHLALRLFDALAADLRLGASEREWLEYAALLHDVGHHIAHRNHHKHSHYLIMSGDLLGFEAAEIEVIALLARYHRKAMPKDDDPDFANLPRELRDTVRTLSAVLRVADSLDRSHSGAVSDLSVNRKSSRVVLNLRTGNADAALEIWEARQRSKPLEQLLGCEVEFKVVA